MDDYYDKWALEYFVEEYYALEKIVSSVVRCADDERISALMSDVVLERLPRILYLYDPSTGAKLQNYVARAIKWYCYKALQRGDKDRERFQFLTPEVQDAAASDNNTAQLVENRELVELMLSRISRPRALLLRWRYMEEMSVAEISDRLAVSKTQVYIKLREAERAARDAINGRPDDA